MEPRIRQFVLILALLILPFETAFPEQTYRDREGRFTLTMPDGWTDFAMDDGVVINNPAKGLVRLNVGKEMTPSIVVLILTGSDLAKKWKNLKEVSSGDATVAGQPSHYRIMQGINPEGVPSFYRAHAFNAGGRSYIFVSVVDRNYEAAKPAIEAIEQSFRLVGASAAPAAPPSPAPAAATQPVQAPAPPPGAAAYRDPRGRFQIPVPPGWDAAEAGDGVRVFRGNSYVNVLIADGAPSASAVLDGLARQIGQQWSNFREMQRGNWKLSGMPADFVVFTGVNPKGAPSLMRMVAASAPGRVFVLLMSVPQSDWEVMKGDLRQIEEGFSASVGQASGPSGQSAPPPGVRPFLGVSCRDVASEDTRISGATQGAVVEQVGPGSPAARAGIQRGDIVVAIDRKAVAGGADMIRIIGAKKPGDMAEILILRQGKPLTFPITLGGQ